MVGILFAVKIFHPEVVDTKAEGDFASLVPSKADCVGDSMVSVFCKVGDKVIVGKDCCLL